MPNRPEFFLATMSNSFFRFKQFTIHHDRCAMKVGTDGVLLGAWTDVGHSKDILDVGTGTGLVALMMAQRNPAAFIRAIDIEQGAVEQAKENAINSPFADRMTVERFDFRSCASLWPGQFDLIVSNPPWFSNSLLPSNAGRTKARHSVSLTLEELWHAAAICLKQNGSLVLILPFDKREQLEAMAAKFGFFLKRETVVYPLPDSVPKRLLTAWTRLPTENPLPCRLTIELARHRYSQEFIDLVKEFYLFM